MNKGIKKALPCDVKALTMYKTQDRVDLCQENQTRNRNQDKNKNIRFQVLERWRICWIILLKDNQDSKKLYMLLEVLA